MIDIPERLLLGPEPGNPPPEVLEAMGRPTLGHLDPVFLELMDGIGDKLRKLFQTENEMTLAMSGTGSAGMPVKIDEWGIDAAYSGTQKCVSCPPGLSPVTLGARAVEKLEKRKSKVQSWYLDLSMIRNYWG